MHKHADIIFEKEKNIFFITGDLNFFNVMSVYQKSLLLLEKAPAFHFDFSNLHSSDSSGLALIIEWMKFANLRQKSIRILNLPESLLIIAKTAGLTQLMPVISSS